MTTGDSSYACIVFNTGLNGGLSINELRKFDLALEGYGVLRSEGLSYRSSYFNCDWSICNRYYIDYNNSISIYLRHSK